MNKLTMGVLCCTLMLSACSEPQQEITIEEKVTEWVLDGQWIVEADGSVMNDPQTSGLTVWRNQLVSISDGSALEQQRRRLHFIDPVTAALNPKSEPMGMASRVRRSCFYQYLRDEPDLEALVVDPQDDNTFYIVTEDATRTGALSPACQARYEQTGSTDYPTLLIRVRLQEEGPAIMTHVRPLQYPLTLKVGDFPNDGIEGLAISPQRELYLGLEKDKAGMARIFSVKLDDDFWQTADFAQVQDTQVKLPEFKGGSHPINALDYYQPASGGEFLLAAARNDNELWVVDLNKVLPTRRIHLQFTAPTGDTDNCGNTEVMDNASIEGIAVKENTLWLVNDPWKKNYLKNIQCEANRPHYEAMAPLLFSLELDPQWFEIQR